MHYFILSSKKKLIYLITISLLLYVVRLYPDDSNNCTLVGRWASGACYSVHIDNNHLGSLQYCVGK